MRQREWMRCTDPEGMLRTASFALHVPSESELAALAAARRKRHRSSESLLAFPFESEAARARRQFRVFTLTVGQPVLKRVDNAVCHAAAETGWRVAEGTASAEEIAEAERTLQALYEATIDAMRVHFVAPIGPRVLLRLAGVLSLLFRAPDDAARCLVVPQPIFSDAVPLLTPDETSACCPLIREIFSLHRRAKIPPYWQPTWVTETAVALARQMYESRDFSAMPILADALQDAGCDNGDILTHCRDTSAAHVRGCWVVDLVLGKERQF